MNHRYPATAKQIAENKNENQERMAIPNAASAKAIISEKADAIVPMGFTLNLASRG